MKYLKKVVLAVLFLSLSGCANSLLNPYSNEFNCPDGFDGECTTVGDAYQKSLNNGENFSPMVKKKSGPKSPEPEEFVEEYSYQKALYKELAGLIKEPVTPVMMPAKQIRVLIPGYVDKDNNYYAPRYVYFVARTAKWTLPADNGVKEESNRVFSIDD